MIKYVAVSPESFTFAYSLPVDQCDRVSRVTTNIFNALKDSDIPHHTTLWNWIAEVVDEHIQLLEKEMSVSFPSKYLLWINLILLKSVDLTWIDFMH